jgi:hypothetical protein
MWMRNNRARGILIVLAVTIAVGGIAARVLYNRVLHGDDDQNACINNLMGIEGAKGMTVQEHGFKLGKIVNQGDLEPYIIGEWQTCPAGGKYTIGPIGTDPKCSIPGHALPK